MFQAGDWEVDGNFFVIEVNGLHRSARIGLLTAWLTVPYVSYLRPSKQF